MQRSRRAFLQRKALGTAISGRKRLYKVSLSLFIGMWVLVFLLNLWIGHGDSYADGSGIVGESIWHESEAQTIAGSASRAEFTSIELDLNDCNKENDEITAGKNNLFVSEENEISLASDPIKQAVENTVTLDRENSERDQRTDRLVRIAPPGLDEFKSKAVSKGKPTAGQGGGITYRVEPDGREYNYASATKGAKILCFNKEAKGASNILEKDKDKYLRNPCSAEEKFVVIELSEETLVDSVEIANFEHYSSNFKDFELLSSLVYPTDNWVKLGNFTAGNAKHAQRFALLEPKWARYLKLNLLSHYGSEFYCTLSILEVYGVDAIERMLEDLISVEENRFVPEETPTKPGPVIEHLVPTDGEDFLRKLLSEIEDVHEPEDPDTRHEVSKNNIPDPITEVRPQQAGRIPGDSVLKILMQKVRSLDLNFSVLERYLEELNARYGDIFKDFDDEIADKDTRLQQISLQIKDLVNAKAVFTKDFEELVSWKSLVSSQLDMLIRDNAILRSEVERVREYQVSMENKGVVLILVSFVFGCLAIIKLFIDALRSLCRFRGECCGEFCTRTYSAAWLLLLLSSGFIVFILLL